MFRNPDLLEKTNMARYDLSTPLTLPGNGQKQDKTGWKIFCNSRNQWFDWYNAYFRVNYTLEATANGAGLAADTESSTLNGSASLINKLVVKSAGKTLYNIDNAHKAVFVKNLLDFPMITLVPQHNHNFGIWILMPQLLLVIMPQTRE